MVKFLLIVMACSFSSNYEDCRQLRAYRMWSMYDCHLERPYMASAWQIYLNKSAYEELTFTKCLEVPDGGSR